MIPLIMEDSNFHFTPAVFALALLLSTNSDYFRSAPFYLILYLVFVNLLKRISIKLLRYFVFFWLTREPILAPFYTYLDLQYSIAFI